MGLPAHEWAQFDIIARIAKAHQDKNCLDFVGDAEIDGRHSAVEALRLVFFLDPFFNILEIEPGAGMLYIHFHRSIENNISVRQSENATFTYSFRWHSFSFKSRHAQVKKNREIKKWMHDFY